MPIWKSKAKDYHLCMRNLVRRCKKLYPTFIKGEIKRGYIITDGEYMRRVFFKCDGIEYTIRLWSVEDIGGGVEIDFTLFEDYRCNDCNEEFSRDIDGGTRCELCADSEEREEREKWVDDYNNSLPQDKHYSEEFKEEYNIPIGGIYDSEYMNFVFDNIQSNRIKELRINLSKN